MRRCETGRSSHRPKTRNPRDRRQHDQLITVPGAASPTSVLAAYWPRALVNSRPERSRRVVSAAPRARSQTGGVNKIVVRHLAAEPKRAAVAVAKPS